MEKQYTGAKKNLAWEVQSKKLQIIENDSRKVRSRKQILVRERIGETLKKVPPANIKKQIII
jgi:hypothetical protein